MHLNTYLVFNEWTPGDGEDAGTGHAQHGGEGEERRGGCTVETERERESGRVGRWAGAVHFTTCLSPPDISPRFQTKHTTRPSRTLQELREADQCAPQCRCQQAACSRRCNSISSSVAPGRQTLLLLLLLQRQHHILWWVQSPAVSVVSVEERLVRLRLWLVFSVAASDAVSAQQLEPRTVSALHHIQPDLWDAGGDREKGHTPHKHRCHWRICACHWQPAHEPSFVLDRKSWHRSFGFKVSVDVRGLLISSSASEHWRHRWMQSCCSSCQIHISWTCWIWIYSETPEIRTWWEEMFLCDWLMRPK